MQYLFYKYSKAENPDSQSHVVENGNNLFNANLGKDENCLLISSQKIFSDLVSANINLADCDIVF